MYNFKEEKADFEKTENEIIQSIIDNETFPLQKTEDDYRKWSIKPPFSNKPPSQISPTSEPELDK